MADPEDEKVDYGKGPYKNREANYLLNSPNMLIDATVWAGKSLKGKWEERQAQKKLEDEKARQDFKDAVSAANRNTKKRKASERDNRDK